MQYPNKYGHFTDDGLEYVITDPRTPRPWFNYMWNDNYMALISHTGGGFSFLETPRDNRLTRMRYNSLPWDRPGRYVILKDTGSGEYWSLSWAPTINIDYDFYECRHGMGYTKITTKYSDIRAELTYFVPTDSNCEIWKINLWNESGRPRDLHAYAFVELMMGNALNDIINQPNDKHFTEIFFDKQLQALNCTRRYWVLNRKVSVEQPNLDWKYRILFGASRRISGFDGSLDAFIGKWRSEANPIAVERGRMSNTEITAGDPIAALQSRIQLAPDSHTEFTFTMAVFPKSTPHPQVKKDWSKISTLKYAHVSFAELKSKWANYFSHLKVETPDKQFNLMLQTWNSYQAAITFDMARNAGFYHGGLLFGTGIRDQFQDILGVVIAAPDRVRSRLLNALRFQFNDGSTLHNFFKLADWGERTNHSDTPLWIPFGIIEYLNETGDLTILDEAVPFYDRGSEPVYEHLKRAVTFSLRAVSSRGLPKIMNGDWNDTLDKVGPKGKGETVWGACFLAYILRKSFPLLEHKQDITTLENWKKEYLKLARVINRVAWDGKWYLRAFKDNGEPLGTHRAKQGKIFINSQTWSVISGIAPKDRADAALHSVRELLVRKNGVQICYPAYTRVEENVGLISRCVPGKKENGAIFNHASSWFVLASLLNGNIDTAYRVYSSMLPLNSARRIDRYEVEPYIFAEYVTSPEHPSEGQASHSWLTGTAVWMYRIGLDYILGFRTTLNGLFIDPHIPAHWKSFYAERRFRGKLIKVTVKNPNKKNRGFTRVSVDGTAANTNFIDITAYPGNTIEVIITM